MKSFGFTLLELLIVLSIAGLLFAIGVSGLTHYYDVLRLAQAQQFLIIELQIARTMAQSRSQNQVLSWELGKNTILIENKQIYLPQEAIVVAVSPKGLTSLAYHAPEGRTMPIDVEIMLGLPKRSITAAVRVIGITGKVVSVVR